MNDQKIAVLFQYYRNFGFEHTNEEIATALNISKKTFFNRYQTKEMAIMIAIQFWYRSVKERVHNQCLHCNFPLEELLIQTHNIQYIYHHEKVFYRWEMEHGEFTSSAAPFKELICNSIQKGIQHYHFQEDIKIEHYADYLLYNISTYFLQHEHKELTLKYLLDPLLTERGKTLWEEMDKSIWLH